LLFLGTRRANRGLKVRLDHRALRGCRERRALKVLRVLLGRRGLLDLEACLDHRVLLGLLAFPGHKVLRDGKALLDFGGYRGSPGHRALKALRERQDLVATR
jgi:hypothetical protein